MELRVGECLRAQDRCGHWYNAKVKEIRGEGSTLEVKIHFQGWAERFDEWIPANSDKLRRDEGCMPRTPVGRVSAGYYEVERLVGKRKRNGNVEYKCRYAGYSEQHDEWQQAQFVSDDLIETYFPHAQEADAGEKSRAEGKGFSLQMLEYEAASVEVKLQRQRDVALWVDGFFAALAGKLQRQRVPLAKALLYKLQPCPPWLFVAMHSVFIDIAALLPGECCFCAYLTYPLC